MTEKSLPVGVVVDVLERRSMCETWRRRQDSNGAA